MHIFVQCVCILAPHARRGVIIMRARRRQLAAEPNPARGAKDLGSCRQRTRATHEAHARHAARHARRAQHARSIGRSVAGIRFCAHRHREERPDRSERFRALRSTRRDGARLEVWPCKPCTRRSRAEGSARASASASWSQRLSTKSYCKCGTESVISSVLRCAHSLLDCDGLG